MIDFYLLFKFLHIISFTAWMAGILYLPRLFVYHCDEKIDSRTYKKFCLMEHRLLKIIMTPAMIATWVFGILLLSNNHSIAVEAWFLIKFLLVLLMSAIQGYFSVCKKNFQLNRNVRTHKHFKIMNEAPTIVLLLVVFLVVFKPSF